MSAVRRGRFVVRAAVLLVLTVSTSGCTLLGWGVNDRGELGDGTRWGRTEPVNAARNPRWSSVDAGSAYSCGIDADRALFCWGSGVGNQLGTGGAQPYAQTEPTRVGTASDWTSVSAGGFGGSLPELEDPLGSRTCGIRAPGALYCWGLDGPSTPAQVGTATDWTRVDVGAFHTCGIRAPGALYCWGRNDFGQLGDGTLVPRSTPTRVGAASDWTTVTAGFAVHTCGIRGTGELSCWGANASGQLGDGTHTDRPVPTRVGVGTDWKQVSAGGAGEYIWYDPWGLSTFTGHTCGLRGSALYCWGENGSGQLGDGTTTDRSVPTREVTASSWTSLSSGGAHTCAIQPDREMYCWGVNRGGFAPVVPTTPVVTPSRILFGSWYAVSAGAFHTQGLRNGSDSF